MIVSAMAKKTEKKTATTAAKPWGGRFDQPTDAAVEKFSASVHYDCELALFDIRQSIAHAGMLAQCGIISAEDFKAIKTGLETIRDEVAGGTFVFSEKLEDVHMNIETRLATLIGAPAGRLHTARSRNDQVVTDLKLYLRDAASRIIEAIRDVQSALVVQAEDHAATVMPGYTHFQRAQPVTLGHHLMAYFFMLDRDAGRFADCADRLNTLPLGAGALAGTALPTDPRIVAAELGFRCVCDNSMDAVADRDFAIEFLSACTIAMNHLGRACEEFVIWMSSEFRFVDFPDALCTGSSIMPQKKNPDVAELIRGKNGRVTGSLISLIVTLKGLPLTYNRDLQEDKEPIFDAVRTVLSSLDLFARLVEGARFDKKRLLGATRDGFLTAVDITDYLVRRGLPFRETHHIVGRLVKKCVDENRLFDELSLDEFRAESELFDTDIYDVLSPAGAVTRRATPGAASPREVMRQVGKAKRILARKK